MDSELLKYPVLAIYGDNTAVAHVDRGSLTSANTGGLRRGCYDGLRIISNEGHYIVDSYDVVDKLTFWERYNPFFYKKVRVRLNLSICPALEVDQIKTILVWNLNNSEYLGEVVNNHSKAEESLWNATSTGDLIGLFQGMQEGRF